MKISDLKPNPDNPRFIRDERFKKLKKSIAEFPKMMALRPIVVDDNNMILGGNQRLKALIDLGYKEIPDTWIKKASELTEEEQRRFILIDNENFGEWDWEMIRSEWNVDEINKWGVDVSIWNNANEMSEDDILLDEEELREIGAKTDIQRVVFIFENKDAAERYLKKYNINAKKQGQAWQVSINTQSI